MGKSKCCDCVRFLPMFNVSFKCSEYVYQAKQSLAQFVFFHSDVILQLQQRGRSLLRYMVALGCCFHPIRHFCLFGELILGTLSSPHWSTRPLCCCRLPPCCLLLSSGVEGGSCGKISVTWFLNNMIYSLYVSIALIYIYLQSIQQPFAPGGCWHKCTCTFLGGKFKEFSCLFIS